MGKIADKKEIMGMYTAIMRREVCDYVKDGHDIVDVPVKPSDMMKAGEALLKCFDRSNPPEKEECCGVIILPAAE